MSFSTAESKIASALNLAVKSHLNGETPNESVKTAALAGGLNAEMTNRLVEAFNISVTRAYLKTAEDKTASFPIADKAVVAKALFADAPLVEYAEDNKKAASFEGAQEGSSFSFSPEIPMGLTKKVAESMSIPDIDRDFSTLSQRISGHHSTSESEKSDLRIKIASAKESAFGAIESLIKYFSSFETTSKFARFEEDAVQEFGEDALQVTNLVYKAANLGRTDAFSHLPASRGNTSMALKRASYRVSHSLPEQIASLKTALLAREEMHRAVEDLQITTEQWDKAKNRFNKIAAPVPGSPRIPERATSWIKERGGWGGVASAGGLFGDPSAGEIVDKGRDSQLTEYNRADLEDFKSRRGLTGLEPKDIAEIEAFRSSSILSEMVAKDEILAAADPGKVVEAYKSLLRLSPDAANDPLIASAVLRSVVSGGAMDPFAAKQIADLQLTKDKSKAMKNPNTSKGV